MGTRYGCGVVATKNIALASTPVGFHATLNPRGGSRGVVPDPGRVSRGLGVSTDTREEEGGGDRASPWRTAETVAVARAQVAGGGSRHMARTWGGDVGLL